MHATVETLGMRAGPMLSARLGLRGLATQPSTTAPVDDAVAQKQANAIIDALPGNSLISKTGILTAGIGAATFLISKEIYVLNEETLIVASFATIVTALIRTLRDPYNAWAADQTARMRDMFNAARKEHALAVQTRIDDVAQLSDVAQVTKDLFGMSREMAEMESEAWELRQKVQTAAEIRSVLDSWVRYEAQVREREQRRVADAVLERVTGQLQDPRMQKMILAQCVADVERLSKQ